MSRTTLIVLNNGSSILFGSAAAKKEVEKTFSLFT